LLVRIELFAGLRAARSAVLRVELCITLCVALSFRLLIFVRAFVCIELCWIFFGPAHSNARIRFRRQRGVFECGAL
jgi:hypothetical protein